MTTRRKNSAPAVRINNRKRLILARPQLEDVKFVQLVIQPYATAEGQGSNLIALGDDGNAYRYYHKEKAWVPYPTAIITNLDN